MADSGITDTETVEFDVPEAGKNGNTSEKKPEKGLSLPKADEKPERAAFSYRPASGLIDSVTVSDWHTSYSYYEQFCAAARKLREYTAEECPHVPFFSYMPQYSQMSPDQLRYYLFLRSEIEEGRYPETDYAYLLLLLYEIINLSDVNDRDYTLRLFCGILSGYRETHERILMQTADWLCDFCLIHGCVPPESIRPMLPELARACGFPEFYIGLLGERTDPKTVLRFSSAYDYTRSRYAAGENRPLFDRHMNGMLEYLGGREDLSPLFEEAMPERFTAQRDAYVGALCAPDVKKRMEISYYSLSRSHELRFLLSDILKYTENRLRAFLGFRSRLSVGTLPPEIRRAADAYLAEHLGTRPRPAAPEVPAYEKLYDPVPSRLTPEAAAAIERESWETTEKLVCAFAPPETPETEDRADVLSAGGGAGEALPPVQNAEDSRMRTAAEKENAEPKPPLSVPTAEENGGEEDSLFSALLDGQREFVRAALRGDREAQKAAAAALGEPAALAADRINTVAADVFGDVILTETDGMFRVLEDYAEDMEKEFAE